MKNDLRRRVGSGKWNLLMRSDDLYHMLARQDRIADYAQNVAEQLSFRPLYDNVEAKALLKEMAGAVAKTAATYEDAVEALRDLTLSGYTQAGRERRGGMIDEVTLAAHARDMGASRAAGFVFKISHETALDAVHMYIILHRLGD